MLQRQYHQGTRTFCIGPLPYTLLAPATVAPFIFINDLIIRGSYFTGFALLLFLFFWQTTRKGPRHSERKGKHTAVRT